MYQNVQDIYNGKPKILLKEIKDNPNQWKNILYSWIGNLWSSEKRRETVAC